MSTAPAWVLEALRLASPENEGSLLFEIDNAPESARYPGILGRVASWALGRRAPRCVTFVALCMRNAGVEEPLQIGEDPRCWGMGVETARVGAIVVWERTGCETTGIIVGATPGARPLALFYDNDSGLAITLPVNEDASVTFRIPTDHFVPHGPLPVLGAWGALASEPYPWAK